MFPSPALSLTMALPIPGTAPVGEQGGEVNGADFLSLLTQTVDQAATTGEAVVEPAAVPATPPSELPAAELAATTGNILPPDLPVAALPESELPPAAEPQVVAPELLLAKSAALAALRIVQQSTPTRGPSKLGEVVETDKPQVAEAEIPEPSDAPVAVAVATPALLPIPSVLPAPAAEAIAAHRPEQPGKNEEAPGQQVRAQVPAVDNRPTHERGQPRVAPAHPDNPVSLERSQAAAPAAQPSAQPITQVRIEVALPDLDRAVVSGPARTPAPIAALLSEEPDSEPLALLPLTAPQAAPQPLANAPATPLTRPQDFAALIDRLSAAREAAQPQAVSVSLPHADFGRVQLHFRHEDGALAVSLASADPDFARIAALSAPAVLGVSEARSTEAAPQGQSQSGTPRGDGQGATSTNSGNARGQNHERRGDSQSHHSYQPRARTAAERHGGRSGIFA